jgi:hypothetical protein
MSKNNKSTAITSYQNAVTEIRKLLVDWFENGVELFMKLREVDQSGIWKHPGHATFADFLRAEFPTALGVERYQNVINAIDMYGIERVKQIGVDSCHALTVKALQDSPTKRARVLLGIDTFVKTNGCAPDRNKVRDLVSSVAPESRRPPRELQAADELVAVRAQLAEAKQRIKNLEAEVRELRKKRQSARGASA